MLHNISFLNTIFNDAPHAWQIGFQDSAAPGFTGMVELHITMFFFILSCICFIFLVILPGVSNLSIAYSINKLKKSFIVILTSVSQLITLDMYKQNKRLKILTIF